VQQLPPGYRIVFNLYAIEGYSHKEIGDQLGISENTSKSQLLKARRSLIERLAKLNTLPRLKYAQNE
ncbi:MAG: sigma-70 region 4 domain-containing protein, partial [Bacteroidetes bacterium]|nr:sigma-70 region 4 domain-containing protein [Bacteroidota bacterium]